MIKIKLEFCEYIKSWPKQEFSHEMSQMWNVLKELYVKVKIQTGIL